MQNKVQQALPRLPQAVQQQGLVVTKSNPDFLMIIAVYDETDQATSADVADYLVSNLQDSIGRLPRRRRLQRVRLAVRDAHLARSGASSRASASCRATSIAAIQAQNTQVAAGQIGAPAGRRRRRC